MGPLGRQIKSEDEVELKANHIPAFLGPALRTYYLANHINNRPLLLPFLPPAACLCEK